MRVSARRQDLKHAVIDRQQSHVKGSTTQIKDQDVFFAVLLVESVRNGGSRGFVDDALDFQAGNRSGIFRGLSLGVVEVRGDGHNGVFDLGTEIGFGGFFHFPQNHPADFFRGKVRFWVLGSDFFGQTNNWLSVLVLGNLIGEKLLVFLHRRIVEIPPDQSFDVEKGSGGVLGGLVFGSISHQTSPARRGILWESHVRWSDAVSLFVGTDIDAVVSPHADARVGGPEIDSDTGTRDGTICSAPQSDHVA
mmetsp:Transcript_19466/g.45171  ORF Transcript_19466/g.45171 Transcript_19466/m.45171 type:complete len:249 (+) Transcript_19466:1581-2327(+)